MLLLNRSKTMEPSASAFAVLVTLSLRAVQTPVIDYKCYGSCHHFLLLSYRIFRISC